MVFVLYSYPIALPVSQRYIHFSRSVDILFDGISLCTNRTLLDENLYFDTRKMPLLIGQIK